jgi:tRNA G18 (ribose-2'-O)-methylase SpoU
MTPRTVTIRSANNHFQRAEVLRRNRQKRQQYGEFFLEGVRPINMAISHDWTLSAFYFSPERGLSDWAKGILRNSRAATHFELSPSLLEQLSDKTDSSELVAIGVIPEDDLSRIPIRSRSLIVIFDRPSNPGNLGTSIRSCDALGVDGLIITGHSADLYDPETIRASTGSLFALPTVRVPGLRELEPWLDDIRAVTGPLHIIGTDESAEGDVWDMDFTQPTVLVAGNEKWGLSAGFREVCDDMVRIPIGGSASSLNVACATSIVLYEVARQRVASEKG